MPKDSSAPGSLELVRSFVNSIDLERPETLDAFADLGGARVWLADAGLDPTGLREEELPELRELREALRGTLLANSGDGDRKAAWARLASAFSTAKLGITFLTEGILTLKPLEEHSAPALRGTLLAIVYDALRDGTWQRLKACRKHSCLFAFYDRTKNGSGAWCSMETCGNRVKAQRRRARERGAASA